MSDAKMDAKSQQKDIAVQPTVTGSGVPSEMKRQMEAAKERLKRAYAVYGQTAGPGGGGPDTPNRSEDR